MKTVTGYLCGPRVYEYKGVVFEVNAYSGPWPLKKDGNPRARAEDKFYDLYAEWDGLPDKESYRIGGGCEPIVKEEAMNGTNPGAWPDHEPNEPQMSRYTAADLKAARLETIDRVMQTLLSITYVDDLRKWIACGADAIKKLKEEINEG